MKLSSPKFWIGLISLAIVLAVFAWETRARVSPGPLAAVHSTPSTGLTDNQACSRCHGDSKVSLASACSDCHEDVLQNESAGDSSSMAFTSGFHRELDSEIREDCGACHLEHRGIAAQLVGDHSFAFAGWPDRAAYDHSGLGLELYGIHDSLECSECHQHADSELLEEGSKRFLGLENTCVSCHEDPHEGQFELDCGSCHGQSKPFTDVADFVHTAEFPLEGAHETFECRRCHSDDGPAPLEIVAGNQSGGGFEAPGCADCHDSPHTEDFQNRAAVLGRVAEDQSCSLCHGVVAGGFEPQNSKLPIALHAASGFDLVAPHAEVDCASCHDPAQPYAAVPRAPNDCGACHEDPHEGQFLGDSRSALAREQIGSDCTSCHASTSFKPSSFDWEHHARSGFEIRGAHLQAECAACHEPASSGRPTRYVGTPGECFSCHDNVHPPEFARESTSCGDCHDENGWSEIASSFDHEKDTGFALVGAHAASRCESCHEPAEFPDARGRIFGSILEHYGTRTPDCADCHADPHDGFFEGRVPEQIDGRTSCARCHDSQVFRPAERERFDHRAHADFSLSGAHESLSCDRCHRSRDAGQAPGERTFGRAAESFPGLRSFESGTADCVACHDDPHGGLFVQGMEVVRCDNCHEDESWRAKAVSDGFDHGRWTGFALTGAHQTKAVCSSCHAPYANPSQAARTFAAALGTSCADCHLDPHAGQFEAKACESCHASTVSFEIHSFDHQRDSIFPLDDQHTELRCSSCHRQSSLGGGRSVVRYKPLGTQCADCHGPWPEDER